MAHKKPGYDFTVYACYVGYLLQAVVVNVSPLLFIPLREQFGFSFSQLGMLVLANFITQLSCDLLFSNAVDKKGFRPFALAAPVFATLGLVVFSLAPILFPANPYAGLFLGTLLFSGSGGLLELLLSPIVNALPLAPEKKSSVMSFVHAAYSWGQVAVVLITTLLLWSLGTDKWQWIVLFWCLPALVSFCMFLRAPFAPGVPEQKRQPFKEVAKSRVFLLCFISILTAGAAELVVGQWASSFVEKALGVTKAIGDVIGVCAFAAAMGLGRVLHGRFGAGKDIIKILRIDFFALILCYLVIAFAPGTVLPLLAIIASGFAVAITWPSMLVVAAEHFPLAGARLFAILAVAGDSGCSLGPSLAGKVMDISAELPLFHKLAEKAGLAVEQLSLRAGMLVGVIFSLVGFIVLEMLYQKKKKQSL
ncbi:MAG: MFS transporter [Clostridia bacterium]|nr:MFS transporter [Clostridia bacterium]